MVARCYSCLVGPSYAKGVGDEKTIGRSAGSPGVDGNFPFHFSKNGQARKDQVGPRGPAGSPSCLRTRKAREASRGVGDRQNAGLSNSLVRAAIRTPRRALGDGNRVFAFSLRKSLVFFWTVGEQGTERTNFLASGAESAKTSTSLIPAPIVRTWIKEEHEIFQTSSP
jgi:hypothetical protein